MKHLRTIKRSDLGRLIYRYSRRGIGWGKTLMKEHIAPI
jgi:predicted GNAT family N-acyltransferase